MKVKDVKRDKSNFKIIDMESDISELIETPVRKPVKQLYRKNIITVMSSANEINVSWQDENGEDMYLTNSDFDSVIFSFGNGYAYIMLDYDSLSDENKAIMNDLYDELNEDDKRPEYTYGISSFDSYKGDKRVIYAIHQIEMPGRAWSIDRISTYEALTKSPDDKMDKEFLRRSNFVYTTPYTRRSIILRYPVDENTEVEEVSEYFSNICERLEGQKKRYSIDDIIRYTSEFNELDKSRIHELIRMLYYNQNKKMIFQPMTGQAIITAEEKQEIIDMNRKMAKDYVISYLRKSISEDMSEKEKYKAIFDFFVERFNYDYSTLDSAKGYGYFKEISLKYRKHLIPITSQIDGYVKLSELEKCNRLLEELQKENNPNNELITLIENARKCYESAEKIKSRKDYRLGDLFATKYGVCRDFAAAFKDVCDEFNLPCEFITGSILSDGVEVGHAWNAILDNGEVKFIDISAAIHSKDGSYPENEPEDFFNVSFSDLNVADNGKERRLYDKSKNIIEEMKKKARPFNPNGGGTIRPSCKKSADGPSLD